VLLILAVLWGIVLGPWAWRAHTQRRRMRSVDNFRRRLQVLAPASDVPRATRPSVASRPAGATRPAVAVVASPPPPFAASQPRPPKMAVRLSRAAVLRRRRRVLAVLVFATVVTLAAGFVPPLRFVWAAHVVFELALVAYVAGLRRLRRLSVERATKVRYLPATAVAVVEAVAVDTTQVDGAVRHSASS
jgi:hypothetical protein